MAFKKLWPQSNHKQMAQLTSICVLVTKLLLRGKTVYRLRESVGVSVHGSESEVGKGAVKLVLSYLAGGSESRYVPIGEWFGNMH